MWGKPSSLAACVGIALLFCAINVPAADMKALHHSREVERCQTCHGDRPEFAALDVEKACVNCHPGGVVPDSKPESPPSPTPAPEDNYGMQGPMYYDTTRFGPEPGDMVLIPAGTFVMGSDERLADEGPKHRVTLPAYLIDRYEVTNLQYKRFIDATGRRSPAHFRNRRFPPGKADHPVTFVSWYDAQAYCSWAGKRLPTEQEWEKAARGEHGRVFPWGDNFDIRMANTPVRWARMGQEGDTTPVGGFPQGASPYGVQDMSGNVWEWTASWYLAHPGNDRASENFGEIYKVLKGGSWWDCSFYKCGISAPTYNRSFFSPRVNNASFGFRCSRDVD